MDNLLQSHYEATLQRISEEKIVWSWQDTTSLNYSAHPLTKAWVPLALAQGSLDFCCLTRWRLILRAPPWASRCQVLARDPKQFGKREFRHERPLSTKRVEVA